MYSLSSTSTSFCLEDKATFATPKILNVNADKTRCRKRSVSETSAESTPAGELKPIGNQPSQTEKNINNKSPNQKAGVEASVKQNPLIRRSTHVPFFIPAIIPNMKPTTPEITQATTSNANEAKNRSPITSTTLLRYNKEVPKSTCNIDFTQLINCWSFDSFNPHYLVLFLSLFVLTL